MKLPRRKFSASGRGRCRAAGPFAHRTGADLSDAAGAHCGRSCRRRRDRHHRAPDGSVAVGAAWPAIRHREPAGCWQQYRHRERSCVRPRTATRSSWSVRRTRSTRRFTTSSISISSATLRRSRASPHPHRHGGESVGSGQDGSRVHRLRQSQSGQDQHGVGRHRDRAARGRRAVQDDGRRRHGARALSRRGARADRPARRAGAGAVRRHCLIDRVHQSRQAARAGGDHRDALGGAAGHPDRGRIRAGLRGERIGTASARPRNTPAEIVDKLNKEINAASPIPR